MSLSRIFVLVAALSAAACSRTPEPASEPEPEPNPTPAPVDERRLLNAASDADNWLSHGRTYDEQRFSPLTQINADTVYRLRLAWYYDLDVAPRGQESTPLVIDGVMYVTGAWSKVFALDARTGKELWRFDPKVPGETAVNACCDVVNRGVAAYEGRIYLGTLDGRLIALHADTGRLAWEVRTTEIGSRYTITGAPRVVKGKVLIGNGGAEMGVRGYVSAYDAADGRLVWRFYTVPGDPSRPFEHQALAMAAKTWTGEWWKLGGGGTVWDSMAYDPQLDLLYIGVGNGSPWDRKIRSPGGGDNLFLSSIVALRPDSGEYVWHYQTTPGDSWNYSATQHMVLANLIIGGKQRAVLMQAPKNGFFYVLDRATGELLSAAPYTNVNWASGIDMKTGRPIENPQARFGETGKSWLGIPGSLGGHNWQPMAFNASTGLVYVPVIESSQAFVRSQQFAPKQLAWNTGIDMDAASLVQDTNAKLRAYSALRGHLLAWDPVQAKEVWRVQYDQPWFGGVLTTAGNLVFEGTAMGEVIAFRADTGQRVWSAGTQAGVIASPISYAVNGEQYIALETGWGGAFGLTAGELARLKHTAGNKPRVLGFKLDGTAILPNEAERAITLAPPPDFTNDSEVADGKALYHRYCSTCHGDTAISGGVLADLRHSEATGDYLLWGKIVLEGAMQATGMVGFASELSQKESEQIRSYVIRRAHESSEWDRCTAGRGCFDSGASTFNGL